LFLWRVFLDWAAHARLGRRLQFPSCPSVARSWHRPGRGGLGVGHRLRGAAVGRCARLRPGGRCSCVGV